MAGPAPKLAKGESLLDAIERIRHRGRELLADANRIRSSPYPSSWAKAQVRAQVAALAQRGAPDVTLLVEHGRDSVTWPMQNLQSAIHNADRAAVGFTAAPDAVALFAWAFRDQLVAALDRAIDEEADDEHALDHGEREKREAEVLADLLMVERSEAALVWAALAQGMPCEHRGLQCANHPAMSARDGPDPRRAWVIARTCFLQFDWRARVTVLHRYRKPLMHGICAREKSVNLLI